MKKIILNKNNINFLNQFRKKNKIVLCHGVFDIMHYGHVAHLNMAKQFGDILVVSITDDVFVNKGPGRPIFSSLIRAKTILNLEAVDFVIISKSLNAIEVLNQIKPNFYVKDKEYQSKENIFSKNFILEKKFLKKINCKIKFTNQIKYSSSNLVNLRFNNFDDEQEKYLSNIKKKYSLDYIEGLFAKFKKLNICLIGDPIIDKYIFSSVEGVASKSPTLASVYKSQENYAGGSLAVASMLANLGSKINLIYYSDKNKLTKIIEKKLDKKINLVSIKSNSSIPIIERIVNIPRYEKLHQMYYFKNFLHDNHSSNNFKKLVSKYHKKSDLTLLIDFGFNFLDKNLVKFFDKFKYSINVHSNSINKHFNIASKYKKPIYLTLNLSEYLSDRRLKYESDINQFLNNIKNGEKKDNFSITLGNKGSIFKKKGKLVYCPSFFSFTKDTTGCGDAYFAITTVLNELNVEPDLTTFLGNIYAGLHANTIGNKSFQNTEELIKIIKVLFS
ncbi:adenylyltransferase/cytidyltransferase family protein [Candidatus Pelagibacter sp.]|nr:adenylyltransferase/cytidyltransferase family protein [Candidatus Pelagibacter sp.]